MKELSIEEKAKRYDDSIKKAGERYNKEYTSSLERSTLAYVFPELKESEDEKIRKAIYSALRYLETELGWDAVGDVDILDAYAWLKKQGEHASFIEAIQVGDQVTKNEDGVLVNLSQLKRVAKKDNRYGEHKPADKVEPKFKNGQWIVFNGLILYVNEVVQGYYRTISIGGIPNSYDWNIDNIARLWTIQDAKDGDVLAAHECLVLFKEIDGLNIRCYCTYHYLNHQAFYVDTLQNKTAFHPATKEQRDTLIKAMADAGYIFDFEKKELKKIEQKTVWSEEDIATISRVIPIVKWAAYSDHSHPILNDEGATELVERLNSLKDRYTWKPSDELMNNLSRAANGGSYHTDLLLQLYIQLKQL